MGVAATLPELSEWTLPVNLLRQFRFEMKKVEQLHVSAVHPHKPYT